MTDTCITNRLRTLLSQGSLTIDVSPSDGKEFNHHLGFAKMSQRDLAFQLLQERFPNAFPQGGKLL